MDSLKKPTDDEWFGEFEISNKLVLSLYSFKPIEETCINNEPISNDCACCHPSPTEIRDPDLSIKQTSSSTPSTTEINSDPSIKQTTSTSQSNNVRMKTDDLSRIEFRIDNTREKQKDMIARIAKAEQMIMDQYEHICFLEEELTRLDQYGRRENIELLGIPESVDDIKLEAEVIKILKQMGLQHINHYNIVACHRIGKRNSNKPRSVILRFLNRKDAIQSLKNKSKVNKCKDIGYNNIRIVENLCPANRSIYENLSSLKDKNIIADFWSFNGNISFKKTNNRNEKAKVIRHENDLDYYFPKAFDET